jgi:hypothetical protein
MDTLETYQISQENFVNVGGHLQGYRLMDLVRYFAGLAQGEGDYPNGSCGLLL